MPKYIDATSAEGHFIVDQPMDADFESEWKDLLHYNSGVMQVTWLNATGVLDGTLIVQSTATVSQAPADWSESLVVVNVVDGVAPYNIWNISHRFYRIKYVANGITGGTLNGTLTAKGM